MRNNCIYMTLRTCYSLWMTVLYAPCPGCIPESQPYRIASTKCRTNKVASPDNGHIVAQNMQRLINVQTEIVHQVRCIYKIKLTHS